MSSNKQYITFAMPTSFKMPAIILNLRSNDGKDRLTVLPSEIQQNIIGYLLPTQDADNPPGHFAKRSKAVDHALDHLAATCKSLRGEVNTFARLWLAKNRDTVRKVNIEVTGKPTANGRLERNYLRGHGGLLPYITTHCVYCAKPCTRPATMMNGFSCCAQCDDIHWDKISQDESISYYDLKNHHLVASHDNRPKLRYGTHVGHYKKQIIFLRRDIEALAKLVHGVEDLATYLAQRKAAEIERERRANANAAFIKERCVQEKAARETRKALTISTSVEVKTVECEWWQGLYPFTPVAGQATPMSAGAVVRAWRSRR